MAKADNASLLRFEYAINPQNSMKIFEAIFENIIILIFFLCELPLILRVGRKRKKRARDICKGTIDIECERVWSVGLGTTLGDGLKIKNYFSTSGISPGKAENVILLGFKCTIIRQNLINIVRAIFEKFEIFNFFLT